MAGCTAGDEGLRGLLKIELPCCPEPAPASCAMSIPVAFLCKSYACSEAAPPSAPPQSKTKIQFKNSGKVKAKAFACRCHHLQRRKSSLITTRRYLHSSTFVAQFLCPLVSVSLSAPFSHPTFLSFSLPSDRLPCLYPILLSSMRSTSSAASVPTAGRSYQPLDFGDDADEQHRAINTFDHVSLIASRLWRCARPLMNRCVSQHR